MDLKTGDTRLIIDACKQHGLLRNQAAYVLGTAKHETAGTMKPVRETLAKSDAGAMAALTKAWKSGRLSWVKKDYWSSGFFGRGYVQLTYEANYRFAGEQLGIGLATRPSLALEPDVAAEIIVVGMRDGWFAGDKAGRHKLSRYITRDKSDFVAARRIVNGTDRADLVAGYARNYDALLKAEGYGSDTPAPKPAPPADAPAQGFWASLFAILLKLVRGGQ
jgi:hypothetical protein